MFQTTLTLLDGGGSRFEHFKSFVSQMARIASFFAINGIAIRFIHYWSDGYGIRDEGVAMRPSNDRE